MKDKQPKPSVHLLLGMILITLEVGVTWYYYIKNTLKLRRNKEDTTLSVVPGTESVIPPEAFEEELARAEAAASNGNGKIVDEPCDCEDEPEPDLPDLSETAEEPVTPVSSLPEEPEPPSPTEPETPETDTH